MVQWRVLVCILWYAQILLLLIIQILHIFSFCLLFLKTLEKLSMICMLHYIVLTLIMRITTAADILNFFY